MKQSPQCETVSPPTPPLLSLGLEFALSCAERSAALPPELGSTIRGGLAGAMRRMVCGMGQTACADCMLRATCAYSVIFEPIRHRADDPEKKDDAPRPYVLDTSRSRGGRFDRGDELRFRMLLLGDAIPHLPQIAAAASQMATNGLGTKRHRFELRQVRVRGTNEAVYDFSPQKSGTPLEPIAGAPIESFVREIPPGPNLTVRFVSPTRLLVNGALPDRLDFRTFYRALSARISMLRNRHGNGATDGNRPSKLARIETVETVACELSRASIHRWSNRQRKHIRLDGFVGEVTWRGDALREVWDDILVGEILHVGKGTVMGMGKYEVITTEDHGVNE